MPDPVIQIRGLGKRYRLGSHARLDQTLSEMINRNCRRLFHRVTRSDGPSAHPAAQRDFWALRDVNFDVQEGEVVGIIGRNGAGKTTLLKILCQITDPTEGQATLRGRVGSLLEVGTGFHPELSGLENIFLNGAILGMRKAEIRQKLDQIVAFADIDKFLDTPVKRYSSGMYVRLAFAVAAHLEPQVLIVDEVLAVGDEAFQQKCLGKMSDVASCGRTVLFVSHNMAAVRTLCTKALVLRNGQVDYPLGEVHGAVGHYLAHVNQLSQTELAQRDDRHGLGRIRITDLNIVDRNGQAPDAIVSGQHLEFRLRYLCVDNPRPRNVVAGITITPYAGTVVAQLNNQMVGTRFERIDQSGQIVCRIPKLPLTAGQYSLNLIIRQNDIIQDWIQEAATVTVEQGDFFGTGNLPPPSYGVLFDQAWSIHAESVNSNHEGDTERVAAQLCDKSAA